MQPLAFSYRRFSSKQQARGHSLKRQSDAAVADGVQSKREFIAAITSTLAFSIFGGAAAIEYFSIGHWSYIAQGVVFLLFGLPAWVLTRAFFAWSESNRGVGLVELIRQIKDAIK